MLSKTLPALLLSLGLLAVAPTASASHNVCHDASADIWFDLGVVGVGVDDLNDHGDPDGVQACVNDVGYSVETTTEPVGTWGPPPPGSGVAVRVCADEGTGDLCDGAVLLDWTGVTIACSTPNSICVWVNGRTVIPLP